MLVSEKIDGGKGFNYTRSFWAVLIFDLSIILVGVANSFFDPDNPLESFAEWGFVTLLSGFQLLFIGLISWEIYRIRRKGKGVWEKSRYIWVILGFGFIYLAFDEVFEFHEGFDYLIHQQLGIEETGLTDRLDDIIVISYLLVGLHLLNISRDEIKKFRNAFGPMRFAFALVILMSIVDVVSNRRDIISHFIQNEDWSYTIFIGLNIVEEAAKLVASGIIFATGIQFRKIAIGLEIEPGSGGDRAEIDIGSTEITDGIEPGIGPKG